MKYIAIMVIVILLVAMIFFLAGGLQSCKRISASLWAIYSAVQRYDGASGSVEAVPTGSTERIYEGDGVTVDASGYARLDMSGCLVDIYRDTALRVQDVPAKGAAICVLNLEHGTTTHLIEKRMIVNTEFAVITSLSTDFLVHLDARRGLLWVIVREGRVLVEAAGGQVRVPAGWQTVVRRGRPPERPLPATRPEVGELFPSLEDLTNGLVRETDWLTPTFTPTPPPAADAPPRVAVQVSPEKAFPGQGVSISASARDDRGIESIVILIGEQAVARCAASPCAYETEFGTPGEREVAAIAVDTAGQRASASALLHIVEPETPLTLELARSADQLVAGECHGPHSAQITARLSRSPQVAKVRHAVLTFQWGVATPQPVPMDRVDDYTFVATIDGSRYCCSKAQITYQVVVYDAEGRPLATASDAVTVVYCIG